MISLDQSLLLPSEQCKTAPQVDRRWPSVDGGSSSGSCSSLWQPPGSSPRSHAASDDDDGPGGADLAVRELGLQNTLLASAVRCRLPARSPAGCQGLDVCGAP
jgi:hypothetical protein